MLKIVLATKTVASNLNSVARSIPRLAITYPEWEKFVTRGSEKERPSTGVIQGVLLLIYRSALQ